MVNQRTPYLAEAGAALRAVHRMHVSVGAPRRRTMAVSGVLVLVILTLLDLAYRSRFGDLHSFYKGVTAWWHNLDPYGQLPETYAGGTPRFIYPPFALLPLSVFAALPFPVAALLTVMISVVCLAFTCFIVLRGVWPQGGARGWLHITVAIMPLLLLLEPVRNTIGQGQVNIWLMALVAADCLVEHPKWPRGLLVGVAAAIKVTPLAFVLFFLVRKDFRASVTTAVTAALTTGLMFVLTPDQSVRFWFGGVLSGPATIVNRDNQTIAAGLNRLGLPAGWHQAVSLALLGLVLAASVVIMLRVRVEGAMLVNAAAALLLSPLSWTAHWVWVVPALVAFAAHVLPASMGRPEQLRTGGFHSIVALTVLLLVGPQILTPAEGPWTGWEHVLVNAYPLLTLAVLLVWAFRLVRRSGAWPATAPLMPPPGSLTLSPECSPRVGAGCSPSVDRWRDLHTQGGPGHGPHRRRVDEYRGIVRSSSTMDGVRGGADGGQPGSPLCPDEAVSTHLALPADIVGHGAL